MKWFKHDSNAMLDAKLKRVRIKYGMEGYGLYWYCLELIAQNVEAHNLTFELEHDSEIISHDTGIHYERVSEMMAFMVNIGLFENASGVITCLKLAARTDEYTAKMLKSIKSVPTISGDSPDKVRSIRIDKIRLEDKDIAASAAPAKADTCPHQDIINLYHEILPECQRVRVWTDKRRTLLRQRWREDEERQNLEWWGKFFGYISQSSFLTGKVNTPNRKPFIADLEWVLNLSNFVKILEGKYEDE